MDSGVPIARLMKEYKMDDTLAQDLTADIDSRVKALQKDVIRLETALAKQRAVNEALLAQFEARAADVAHLAIQQGIDPGMINAHIIAAIRDALK